MTTDTITIDAPRAAVLYHALGKAIIEVDATLKLRSAQPFAVALALERSAYKAEQDKLAAVFPRLNGHGADEDEAG